MFCERGHSQHNILNTLRGNNPSNRRNCILVVTCDTKLNLKELFARFQWFGLKTYWETYFRSRSGIQEIQFVFTSLAICVLHCTCAPLILLDLAWRKIIHKMFCLTFWLMFIIISVACNADSKPIDCAAHSCPIRCYYFRCRTHAVDVVCVFNRFVHA